MFFLRLIKKSLRVITSMYQYVDDNKESWENISKERIGTGCDDGARAYTASKIYLN